MAIHRVKLKDLDAQFIQKLKMEQKDENKEISIFIPGSTNMMGEEAFWKVISLLDKTKNSNQEIIEPAVHFLAQLSVKEIEAFENSLAEKLYLLDGMKFAQNIGDNAYKGKDDSFSVDAFLYARCAVIAAGEKVLAKVYDAPEEMLKNQSFEPLLHLASLAYTKKTGKRFDFIPAYIYETFANADGWNGKGLLGNIFDS